MEAWKRCGKVGISDKVGGEDSGGRARRRRCGTTGMNTAAEEIRDGNRIGVVRRRWRSGLEERQQSGQIFTRNKLPT